mgnify:CR=1 FL=1
MGNRWGIPVAVKMINGFDSGAGEGLENGKNFVHVFGLHFLHAGDLSGGQDRFPWEGGQQRGDILSGGGDLVAAAQRGFPADSRARASFLFLVLERLLLLWWRRISSRWW